MTDVKACCASAYDDDVVALVLGASYHPGGLTLTRRLAELAGLHDGQRLLDVACGPGASPVLLALEHDITVDAVDLGTKTLDRAREAAEQADVSARVRFRQGDAEKLPFPDAVFDVVLSECAFCTFPDKAAAAAEFARVLAPGGRIALSDVTVADGALPDELAELAGWIACLADAQPAEQYARLFSEAGLRIITIETHDDALARMIEQIDARLRALRMTPGMTGLDIDRARHLTSLAARAAADGIAGYVLLVAQKP